MLVGHPATDGRASEQVRKLGGRMKMSKTLVSVLLVVAASVGWTGDIPDGKLGFALGTYLTIQGKAHKGGPKVNPTSTLVVDTVNGKGLEHPSAVIIEPLVGILPQSGRIVVKGYETGRMVGGLPPGVPRVKGATEPQAVWQFYRTFVITSWAQPKGPARYPGTKRSARHRQRLAEERKRLLEKYRAAEKPGEKR
jgi:hypothetical protein